MLNFKSENKGTWFYFDPTDESAGGVCLRELTTEEYENIEKLTVKTSKKFKRGQWVEDKKVNEKLASKLRWSYCITDWNKVALDGVELDCTNDNKVKMMKVLDFVKHVVDSLNELVDSNKSIEESKLKNSESSSNDNSENQTV